MGAMQPWHLIVLLILLIIPVVVVIAVVLIVRAVTRSNQPSVQNSPTTGDSSREAPPGAREVLDQRLARGEISLEEHDRLRAHLET